MLIYIYIYIYVEELTLNAPHGYCSTHLNTETAGIRMKTTPVLLRAYISHLWGHRSRGWKQSAKIITRPRSTTRTNRPEGTHICIYPFRVLVIHSITTYTCKGSSRHARACGQSNRKHMTTSAPHPQCLVSLPRPSAPPSPSASPLKLAGSLPGVNRRSSMPWPSAHATERCVGKALSAAWARLTELGGQCLAGTRAPRAPRSKPARL